MTTLAALVSHLGGQHSDEDVPKLQALLATVKSVLKTHVTRAKQVGLPGFSNYLVTLPSTVAELPGPMITHFFPTGAFTPPVDLNPIWASAALWLCRSTNRQVNLVRQLTGGGGQLTDGVSSVAAVAQQAALQTVAAFAAMSSGVGQGVALPGIEILPAGHQAIARAKQQARPSPLVALMDRVEAQGTEQGAASTQGGTVESQAPVMVASPQATQPTNSGASAALPATVPQVQAESSVPTAPVLAVVSPVTEAQCAQADLDLSVRSLAAQHYGANLEPMPNEQPTEDEPPKKRPAANKNMAAKRGRPAASSAVAKPQPRKTGASKKPAASAKAVCRKPAACAKAVLKKPAPRCKTAGEIAADGRELQVLTRAQTLKKRPTGCGRCRSTPGCCPSCWKLRGFRVLV